VLAGGTGRSGTPAFLQHFQCPHPHRADAADRHAHLLGYLGIREALVRGTADRPGAVALLLTIGTMNAYYAGAAKLGAALGRDGALPAWLAAGSVAGEVPRRSLTVIGVLSLVAQLVVLATGVGPKPLVLLTTGLFVTVYAVGVAAALRLLPRHSRARAAAVVALVIVVVLLVMSGVYLIWALLVIGGALLYVRRTRVAA